jgi:hypothetical protein
MGWPNSMFGNIQLGCVALCEIITAPELKGQPNPYWVVANEDYVQTRYFFIFPSGSNYSPM